MQDDPPEPKPEQCPMCGCAIGDERSEALASVYCNECRSRRGITNMTIAELNAADGEGSEI